MHFNVKGSAQRPFLLLTNDDGIQAPGLKHLWQAVHEHADLAIVAPNVEKSGCGLSITWAKPLRLQSVAWENGTPAWAVVNGTPADCVKMACSVILEKRPQMILSGVNRGSNAGRTVLYSGTAGGVIEGVYKKIPGIAFSFSDTEPPSLGTTRSYILSFLQYFLAHPMPEGTFMNVTFPYRCQEGVKGVSLAKQGSGYWVEAPEKRLHPEGLPYYWLGGKWGEFEEDPESDVALLEQGYITAVPIQVSQLTHFTMLEQHKARFQQFFADSLSMADQRALYTERVQSIS
jgi:5'-nucleotidase